MHSVDTIDALVYDWLIRSGYQSTFSKLPTPIYAQAQSQASFLSFRAEIAKMIRNGRIEEAINLIESEYKNVLENQQQQNQQIVSVDCFKNIPKTPVDLFTCLFLLKLQNFIEFIRKRDTPSALNYIQNHLLPFSPAFENVLQDILGILVYADPENSPMAWCFEQTRRYSALAALTNASLYNLTTKTTTAPLESLLKQVHGVDGLIKELNGFENDLDDRKWSTIQNLMFNNEQTIKNFIKTIKNE